MKKASERGIRNIAIKYWKSGKSSKTDMPFIYINESDAEQLKKELEETYEEINVAITDNINGYFISVKSTISGHYFLQLRIRRDK